MKNKEKKLGNFYFFGGTGCKVTLASRPCMRKQQKISCFASGFPSLQLSIYHYFNFVSTLFIKFIYNFKNIYTKCTKLT